MRAFGDSISKVVVIVADYIALPVVFVDVVYGESVYIYALDSYTGRQWSLVQLTRSVCVLEKQTLSSTF